MEKCVNFKNFIAILLTAVLTSNTSIAAAVPGYTLPCLTPHCVQEAAYLISRMNTSIDPCDDFYEFVCGRYIQETELPDDKMELDPLSATTDLLSKQVKKVISEDVHPGEIQPFILVKKFYAACMNTTAIEKNSIHQLKTIFASLGGWPILEKDKWVESNWIDLIPKLRKYGFSTGHFITIDTDVNPKNSSEYIISVDQALNEEVAEDNLRDGLKDRLVRSYANFLIDLVVLFGVDRDFATKEVHDVISFRAKIAELLVSKTEHVRLIVESNETNVAALQKTYPSIPWIDLIKSVFALPNTTITAESKVILVTPNYISKFQELIKITPKRVQVNHALLQIIREVIYFMPKSFRDREQKFEALVFGTTKAHDRWDLCVAKAKQQFDLAVDALYVRKYVDEHAKKDVTKMVSYIKNAFVDMLKTVDWMDGDTKRLAIEKAQVVNPVIAYPVELMDDEKLKNHYAQVNFDSEDILVLIGKISKFNKDQQISFYGKPVVKNLWTNRISSTTCNAAYDPQSNSIHIPSGIMQNEFYNKNRPQYMNYGGLGLVIGHELTHGFDDTGKEFDKEGNTVNWWQPSTDDSYTEKAKCFIQQFGNFSVPETKLKINGENTLGENIADNGGLKEAYLAYLEWVKQNKEELPLPGLNYTTKQLFWISVANAWCSKSRPSAIKITVLLDEHPPNRYRMLGGLHNVQYFSDDFNCPVGSNMNPNRKCKIW